MGLFLRSFFGGKGPVGGGRNLSLFPASEWRGRRLPALLPVTPTALPVQRRHKKRNMGKESLPTSSTTELLRTIEHRKL